MPAGRPRLHEIAVPPDLPGAACVRRDVFDAAATSWARPYAHDRAIRVCERCPALAACRAWVEGLHPVQRPAGVTAGLVRRARF